MPGFALEIWGKKDLPILFLRYFEKDPTTKKYVPSIMVCLILYQEIIGIISCPSFTIIYAAMAKQSKGGNGLMFFPRVYHMWKSCISERT